MLSPYEPAEQGEGGLQPRSSDSGEIKVPRISNLGRVESRYLRFDAFKSHVEVEMLNKLNS